MKNAELIARLKEQCDRDAAEHCPAEIIALQAEGIAAIEPLEEEVERLKAKIDEHTKLCVKRVAEVTRERNIAQAQLAAAQAEVERLTLERDVNKRMRDQHFAEVERLTTLTRGQHIELYNARLQLAAAQGQCDTITELNHAQWLALENVRMLAARNRKEEWAQHLTRFCNEAWNVNQILRAAPIPQQPAPSVLIGEMRDNGVVWLNRNPHAWPLGTTY